MSEWQSIIKTDFYLKLDSETDMPTALSALSGTTSGLT